MTRQYARNTAENEENKRSGNHTWEQPCRKRRGCQRQEASPSLDRHYQGSHRDPQTGLTKECQDCATAENFRNFRRYFYSCKNFDVLSLMCLVLKTWKTRNVLLNGIHSLTQKVENFMMYEGLYRRSKKIALLSRFKHESLR